ncbi:MAG: hypothetical protein ABEK84_06650 [Salinibacter sp.]
MRFRLALLLLPLLVLALPATAQNRASLGGYGELHYNEVLDDGRAGQLDFHRFILYAGYNFNDWISFRSELELEHTLIEVEEGGAEGGEVALEQAYVDLRPSRAFGVRAGLMLVPVGLINPVHEPPTFNGVERPRVAQLLIPTTWRENGIGIVGRLANGLSYEAYLMAGLDPYEVEDGEVEAELSPTGGIAEAPQDGFKSSVDNLAWTARLDYQATLNLSIGGSLYHSGLSSDARFGDALDGVRFTLLEGHAQYNRGGLQSRAVVVYSTISNADVLNDSDLVEANVGASQLGGYLELGYDVLPFLAPGTSQQLVSFVRYEPFDTALSEANAQANRTDYTVGLTYKPTSQVAFKADLQWFTDGTDTTTRRLNLGVGYNF